jgi:LPXTG-site transpeptidase (sortase) family protein
MQSAERKPNFNRYIWIPMVVIGGLVVYFALTSIIRDYHFYYSPLDQVDESSGLDQGFIPIYAEQDTASNPEQAPTLAGGAAAQPFTRPTSQAGGKGTPAPTTAPTRSLASELPYRTATPLPIYRPDRIVIPSLKLDAPIVPIGLKEVEIQGQTLEQWVAPNKFAAGWQSTSAPLGVIGNTVLIGHHNIDGEVFRDIHTLQEGDQIFLYSGDKVFAYKVGLNMILKERFQPVEVRLKNALWIMPSQDERLTLVTCWPYESNTHRVIIVALPEAQVNDNLR